jgi:hypothetical protein
MANALYDLGRNAFLTGGADWDTDDIRIALVKAGYTQNLATDQFISTPAANIPSASWRSSAISGATGTAGVANHTAKTLTAVASDSSNAATRILYYKFNASDAAAPLLVYIDTATGLPVTPNGGDITITPDSGSNKLFKL